MENEQKPFAVYIWAASQQPTNEQTTFIEKSMDGIIYHPEKECNTLVEFGDMLKDLPKQLTEQYETEKFAVVTDDVNMALVSIMLIDRVLYFNGEDIFLHSLTNNKYYCSIVKNVPGGHVPDDAPAEGINVEGVTQATDIASLLKSLSVR